MTRTGPSLPRHGATRYTHTHIICTCTHTHTHTHTHTRTHTRQASIVTRAPDAASGYGASCVWVHTHTHTHTGAHPEGQSRQSPVSVEPVCPCNGPHCAVAGCVCAQIVLVYICEYGSSPLCLGAIWALKCLGGVGATMSEGKRREDNQQVTEGL